MEFVNETHEKMYKTLTGKLNSTESGLLKICYLLSVSDRLIFNADKIINFTGGFITPSEAELLPLSIGERTYLAVAYNLYNGYCMAGVTLSPQGIKNALDKRLYAAYLKTLEE